LNWVLLDVRPNAVELGLGSNHVIVAFVLPKGLATAAEQAIGAVGCQPFQGSQPSRSQDYGSHENVHVIGHYDAGVQLITMESLLAVVQGRHHHLREFRALQI
jgi:hypothetical protein